MEYISIKTSIIHSARWSVVSTIIRQLSQIAVTIILARHLVPEEFASAGIAIAFISFFTIISQVGMAQAIVISENSDKRFLDSINSCLITVGIFCYILVYMLAPILDKLYEPTHVSNIIQITGFLIIINAIGSVPTALLQKKLDFLGLSLINIISALVQLSFTLYFVSIDLGVWAIVIPLLIGGVITSLLSCLRSGYQPWFAFDFLSLRKSQAYGTSSLLSQILNFLCLNSVVLTMGRMWSPLELGQYIFVDSKVLKPYELITLSFFSNLFPILARISDDVQRLGAVFVKIGRVAAYTIIPVYVTLIIAVPLLVPFLFGSAWSPTIPLFQVLMLVGIARSIGFGANSIFYTLQVPARTWHLNLIRLAGYCVILFFAWFFSLSIISLAFGVVMVEAMTGLCGLLFALRSLGIGLVKYLRILKIDLIFLLIFTGGMVLLADLVISEIMGQALKIVAIVLTSAIYYLLLLLIFHRQPIIKGFQKFIR